MKQLRSTTENLPTLTLSNMTGWVKLHRSLLEWEWYDDHNAKMLFLHCLLMANHKDSSYKGQVVKRGTFLTGFDLLSRQLGVSVRQIRTAMKKLESTGELTRIATNKGQAVTVVEYDKYQSGDSKATSKMSSSVTDERQASDKQATTNKNDKNVENDKNTITETPSAELFETGEETKPKSKPRPTQDEVIDYLLDKMPQVNPDWTPERIKRAGSSMYEDWVENKWRDGNNKPIKNWKSKSKNVITNKKPWNFGASNQQQPQQQTIYRI